MNKTFSCQEKHPINIYSFCLHLDWNNRQIKSVHTTNEYERNEKKIYTTNVHGVHTKYVCRLSFYLIAQHQRAHLYFDTLKIFRNVGSVLTSK